MDRIRKVSVLVCCRLPLLTRLTLSDGRFALHMKDLDFSTSVPATEPKGDFIFPFHRHVWLTEFNPFDKSRALILDFEYSALYSAI